MRGIGLVVLDLLMFFCLRSGAQVVDNFSDGDFSYNPSWTGDSAAFEINSSGQLHLKTTASDTAILSTANQLIDSTEWSFWAKLSFSPSSNNYARIYLSSDQCDLKLPLNGYFLQLGEAGSEDAIRLYRQSGTDLQLVCSGTSGLIAASFAIRIKVTRSHHGKWILYCDPAGGINYQQEGTAYDSLYKNTQYFGVFCQYTSSNATKFYFDDFVVREIFQDTTAPCLEGIFVADSLHLSLKFSEPLVKNVAEDPSHYLLFPYAIHPNTSLLDPADALTVCLAFVQPLQNEYTYTVAASRIQDLAGNESDTLKLSFTYYVPRPFDVQINEIMADPEPQCGLPPCEYVELYNRSDFPIALEGWQFGWSTYRRDLPAATVEQHGYLLLGAEESKIFMTQFGNFISIPSFFIPNDGTLLTLCNRQGQVISHTRFESGWYGNPLKEDGGWSLEQKDPSNPCGGIDNWTASNANRGGTPGSQNSVFSENPDLIRPRLKRAYCSDDRTIRLEFSEALDSTGGFLPDMFQLLPGLMHPVGISTFAPEYQEMDLFFADSLKRGVVYTLILQQEVMDCSGNHSWKADSLHLGLPDQILPNDLVINEVLFHPKDWGSEFVEICNRSNKILDMKHLVLGIIDTINHQTESAEAVSDHSLLLFPSEYILLAKDPARVAKQYTVFNTDALWQMDAFPALSDEGRCLFIGDKSLNIIDMMAYNEEMHYPLLSTTTGVSLERISPDAAGLMKESWHSAASVAGYATPARRNSQWIDVLIKDNDFQLEPKIFSPDNDGFDDVLSITYKLASQGFMASIQLFSLQGQRIKRLVNNELLGTEGVFYWDGLNDEGQRVSQGIYLAFIEIFNLDAQLRRIKLPFAVAQRY